MSALLRRALDSFKSREFLRFLLVGGISAALHWLARYALSSVMAFEWAVFFAYAVGITIAFILNKIYVFPHSNQNMKKQIVLFVVTNLAFFPVIWFSAVVLAKSVLPRFGMQNNAEGFAHAISLCIPMLLTFLIYRLSIFNAEK